MKLFGAGDGTAEDALSDEAPRSFVIPRRNRFLLMGGCLALALLLSGVAALIALSGVFSAPASGVVGAVSEAAEKIAEPSGGATSQGGALSGSAGSLPKSGLPVLKPGPGDVDGDEIPDWAELKVCGSLTCATRWQDSDRDGVPDWVEVEACGSTTCADPTVDTDRDGIPDYTELLVCGTRFCASGSEDADRDGVADWAEFVICGTRGCATGFEDYNRDGVSDADELMACVRYPWLPPWLAHTGEDLAPWFIIVGAAGLLIVGGLLVWGARRQSAAGADVVSEGVAG